MTAALNRLRKFLPKVKVTTLCLVSQVRCASLVSVERHGNMALMQLNRKPVNSFSLEFLEEINNSLEDLENDRECQGLIITSGLPKVFSAGLDLVKEMYRPDKERLGLFWSKFQEMWLRLYGSRLVTMAAISGHALAGGCVLGLSCDYRVMAEGLTIGLVELETGVPVPFWMYNNLVRVVGRNAAEKAILTSKRYSSEEALAIRMVDKVVPKERVLSATKEEMEKWLIYPAKPREITKKMMREEFIEALGNVREKDVQDFINCILEEDVQKSVGQQIERLTKKA